MTVARRRTTLTTRGRCLLAGGIATAACSVLLDERDLLRLGVFTAALPLLAILLATGTGRALRVHREIAPNRLPVGTPASVRLRCMGGPLLGPMHLSDALPDAVAGQTATARFTLNGMSPRSTTILEYSVRPVLRGRHQVGPLAVRTVDPLGLAETRREIAEADTMLVLPRIVPLRGVPPALGSGDGTSGATVGHQGAGAADLLVRPYRQGDDLRRVHWRSTARHDELMVRLEERPWRGSVTVLLDRRDAAHRGHGPGSSLEYAVSLVASVCAHLVHRGDAVTVVTEDGVNAVTGATGVSPTDGRTDLEPVLDALAALRPSARTDLTGPALVGNDTVLAVLGALAPGDVEVLLARYPHPGNAVLLDVATWLPNAAKRSRPAGTQVAPAAEALRRAGWQVTVAAATTPPQQVWDDLGTAHRAVWS